VRALLLALLLSACARDAAPRSTPTYDTSCEHDWDCVPAPGCCPAPCTSIVINAKDQARARNDLRCDPAEHCPVAGSCQTHEYLCVRNACKLVLYDEPDFRKRETPPGR
jgi:hypothetical protein